MAQGITPLLGNATGNALEPTLAPQPTSFADNSVASTDAVQSASEARGLLAPSTLPAKLSSQTAQLQQPTQLAQAQKPSFNLMRALTPAGIFFGVTGPGLTIPGLNVKGLLGGHFWTISLKNGEWRSVADNPLFRTSSYGYYGSYVRLLTLPTIRTPWGEASGSLTLVGTQNPSAGQPIGRDELGVNVSYRVPTPFGDILFWGNARQDALTGGNLIDAVQGKARGTFTFSVQGGLMFSVSDGVMRFLAASYPGVGIALGAATALLDASKLDAWAGFGFRMAMEFKDWRLASITINGEKISFEEIGTKLAPAINEVRTNFPLPPNGGDPRRASLNDSIQLLYGQSPWDVGFAAIRRGGDGTMLIKNGTVDVLNHGNRVTQIVEPIYELGVKYSRKNMLAGFDELLLPGQRVLNNEHAGRVIDFILRSAKAESNTAYANALARLMNPYHLHFNSSELKAAYDLFNSSGTFQTLVNLNRGLMKLQPLPVNGVVAKPKDYDLVRAIFQGEYRWPGDYRAGSGALNASVPPVSNTPVSVNPVLMSGDGQLRVRG